MFQQDQNKLTSLSQSLQHFDDTIYQMVATPENTIAVKEPGVIAIQQFFILLLGRKASAHLPIWPWRYQNIGSSLERTVVESNLTSDRWT